MKNGSALQSLAGRLIVSCQPVKGGPLDRTDFVVAMAEAAAASGAGGVRIEGVERVAATVERVTVPVIGIVKRSLPDYPVHITPWLRDVRALADAGAALIAFDGTDRHRPVSVADLIREVEASGCFAMSDCSTVEDAVAAAADGSDVVSSTMSGYTGESESEEPDFELVRALASRGLRVMAEGRIRRPEQAAQALAQGAWAVTVGSAITRVEYVTDWFAAAMTPEKQCTPAFRTHSRDMRRGSISEVLSA